MDLDVQVTQGLWIIRAALADTNKIGDRVVLENGQVCRQGGVGWAVEDEKAELTHFDGADADSGHGLFEAVNK